MSRFISPELYCEQQWSKLRFGVAPTKEQYERYIESCKIDYEQHINKFNEQLYGTDTQQTITEASKNLYPTTSPYVVGTIKLTWIEPNDFSILSSQMFDSLNEALKVAEGKKDWLIFQLKQSEGNMFKWQLLPYGESKNYLNSMKINNFAEKYGFYILAAFGVYLLVKE